MNFVKITWQEAIVWVKPENEGEVYFGIKYKIIFHHIIINECRNEKASPIIFCLCHTEKGQSWFLFAVLFTKFFFLGLKKLTLYTS